MAALESDGGVIVHDYVLDVRVPTPSSPPGPAWRVAAYCVTFDGMNYGEANTTVAESDPPPTTTTTTSPGLPTTA